MFISIFDSSWKTLDHKWYYRHPEYLKALLMVSFCIWTRKTYDRQNLVSLLLPTYCYLTLANVWKLSKKWYWLVYFWKRSEDFLFDLSQEIRSMLFASTYLWNVFNNIWPPTSYERFLSKFLHFLSFSLWPRMVTITSVHLFHGGSHGPPRNIKMRLKDKRKSRSKIKEE